MRVELREEGNRTIGMVNEVEGWMSPPPSYSGRGVDVPPHEKTIIVFAS